MDNKGSMVKRFSASTLRGQEELRNTLKNERLKASEKEMRLSGMASLAYG